jgi:hypothetical protein
MIKRAQVPIEPDPWPSALDHMLCWNPGTDQVAIVPLSDYRDNSEGYLKTHLACMAQTHELTRPQRKLLVLILAFVLIVREKCDPAAVHRALSELSEYRAILPPCLAPHGGWREGDWQLEEVDW